MKWILIAPKALLREPKRDGKRGQGAGEVAQRFQAVKDGKLRSLMDLLRKDEEHEKRRRERREQEGRRETEEETTYIPFSLAWRNNYASGKS